MQRLWIRLELAAQDIEAAKGEKVIAPATPSSLSFRAARELGLLQLLVRQLRDLSGLALAVRLRSR
jgi:hypothetical protein